MIRTRAMRASPKTMPKKERLPSPGEAGTKLLNIRPPSVPKHLDQRAGFAVSVRITRPAPIRQVNVREDRSEPIRRRRLVIGARHEEGHLCDVAIDRAEEPLEAERLEDGCVGRVVKGIHQAGEWSLHKPRPRCGEEGAAVCQEASEWRSHDGGRGGTATVPVDLTSPA